MPTDVVAATGDADANVSALMAASEATTNPRGRGATDGDADGAVTGGSADDAETDGTNARRQVPRMAVLRARKRDVWAALVVLTTVADGGLT